MIDEKYVELMNRAIDETLTPAEKADLDDHLKANPEARRYYEKLRRTVAVLSEMPSAEAPADFKAAVMDSIRNRAGEPTDHPRMGLFDRLAGAFRTGKAWRYTYAFSAGVACGLLILAAATYFSSPSEHIDISQVSGTMGAVVPESTTLIEKQGIALNNTRGTIEVRRGDEAVYFKGDLMSPDEMTIEVSYDSNDLVPATIWQPEPYSGDFSADQNTINLHFPGNSRFTIIFRDRSPVASTISCRIVDENETDTLNFNTESLTQ